MNAIFALVLLILVLVATVYALVSKNPDTRYQPMRDDRASFIKSNSEMVGSTELDALGATARGDQKTRDLDADDSSADRSYRSQDYAAGVPLPPSQAASHYSGSQYAASQSGEPGDYEKRYHSPNPYQQTADRPFLAPTSPVRSVPSPTRAPHGFGDFPGQGGYNNNQNNQRWQVGAGYDH